MLKSVAIATISAALATMAVAAPPQTRGAGKHQSFDALKTYLSLTDEQIASIKDARKAQREAAKANFPELQAKHKAMQEALQSGTADATTLGNMLLDQQAARKKMQADRTAAHEQLLGTLTPEQQTKLQELKGKREPAAREAMRLGLLTPDRHAGAARGFGRRGPAMGFRGGANTQKF